MDGRQDSPEADAVRDAADAPWTALTEVEKKRLAGLSEDLYSITDPPQTGARELNPQVQSRLVEVAEARERGEWDRAFELLRRWAAYIEPAVLSYLRGSTWLHAGDLQTATLFFEHASNLEPENGNYLAILLNALSRVDPLEGAVAPSESSRPPIDTCRSSSPTRRMSSSIPFGVSLRRRHPGDSGG